jgi:hypothetical protein
VNRLNANPPGVGVATLACGYYDAARSSCPRRNSRTRHHLAAQRLSSNCGNGSSNDGSPNSSLKSTASLRFTRDIHTAAAAPPEALTAAYREGAAAPASPQRDEVLLPAIRPGAESTGQRPRATMQYPAMLHLTQSTLRTRAHPSAEPAHVGRDRCLVPRRDALFGGFIIGQPPLLSSSLKVESRAPVVFLGAHCLPKLVLGGGGVRAPVVFGRRQSAYARSWAAT